MKISKLKKILYKYHSDLIIKAKIDNEVICKLEYSYCEIIGETGLQIMGDYYICNCKPITVSELLNNLKEAENGNNIILFENVIECPEDITYKKYDIKEVIQKDDSLILVGAYIGTEIYPRERGMDLLQQYKNITGQIRMHIKTELEERYKDVKFDDDDTCLLCFNIGCWYFEIDITNNDFRIEYFNEIVRDNSDFDYLATFEEIYKYIDDVISEGY